jgi:peptidoglycan/xylan/chitin deacetylase (PgdA/CDA1 family)
MSVKMLWNKFHYGFLALLLVAVLAMPLTKTSGDTANLMINPSVETSANNAPTAWTPDSWGNNTPGLSYNNSGHTGNFSLTTTLSNRVGGDAKWIPDATSVTANQTYTYSDYYISDVATEIDAQYTDTSGNVSYVYLGSVPASSTWTPANVAFKTPANVAKVSILHILAANGTLRTDDFSLTGDVPVVPPPNTDGNLVANASFETANGSAPADWLTGGWGTNTTTYPYITNDGHTGTHSAEVNTTSFTNGDAKWYFKPVAVQPNTTYAYSDFYKSTLPSSLVAQYDNGSGSFTYQTLSSLAASTGWKQASATFTTPSTAKSVTIFHLISGVGTLQIDDVSMTPDAGTPPPPPDPTPPPAGTNSIPNPSVETVDPGNSKKPQSWNSGSWGTNTVKFSYPTTGHTGSRSVKTQLTSYSSGSAYWYADNQPVTGGQMYDYSDYYQSNVISEIDAAVNMSDGSITYMYLGAPSRSPHSWSKFETQFRVPEGAVSISFYHNIYSVGWLTTDDFSLTPFSYQGFNRPIVTITDDDGYKSYYNNGLPILKKYNLPATDYIITGYVNKDPAYMTSAMVKNLYVSGHEIASHSVTHPDLTTLGATKMDNELKNSQTFLSNLLGVPIPDYAAPYGASNDQVVTDAKKYYQSYRGVQAGYNAKNNFDPYNLVVQNIVSTTTTEDIQGWLDQAKATNTWLILVYHQVDPSLSAGDYNTYPNDFDAHMAAVKASGLPVETISQALSEIKSQL